LLGIDRERGEVSAPRERDDETEAQRQAAVARRRPHRVLRCHRRAHRRVRQGLPITRPIYTAASCSIFTARRCASAVYAVVVCPSVRPVRHMPVLYRNDWTNRAVFLPWRLRFTYPTLCFKEIWVSPKLGTSLWDFAPKLSTWKILPRQVDRVINETHCRRRRRSSLLTTPIGQSTSRSTVTL